MTRYLAIKRSVGGALALTVVSIWQFVLMCVGLQTSALAAAATISIPGAISVTIQPPEAVADGARWSVDGGAGQESGASITNLAAGAHTVQFTDLAAWQEPDTVEVLVIGGKQAMETATYRPLPRFYFRDVPRRKPSAS